MRKEPDDDWPEVDRELARALELNRECPLARLRRVISGLLPRGLVQEATIEMEDVLRSDPLSPLAFLASSRRSWIPARR